MSEEQPKFEQDTTDQGIKLLKVLCVLTFGGSGLGLLSYGFIGAFFNLFSVDAIKSLGEDQQDAIRMLLSGGRYFFIANAILYAVSLRGAFLMWQLRKFGFHLYTLAQLFILISPMVFIKGFQMPWMSVVLSILFIAAYAGFLKKMD